MRRTILSLIILTSVFTFTGCFDSNDNADTTNRLKNFIVYKAPTFSISIPNQWQTIEPKDFTSNIPKETQIIFRDNIQNSTFTTNANVTKRILSRATNSLNYGKEIMAENKQTLLNFREISRDEDFNIAIGGQMQKSLFVLFEGKENEVEPTIRIAQTYAVNSSDAYTVTVAYLPDTSDLQAETSKNIVKSFKVE
ncbi:hypothetical protein J7J83_00480 [bacterium]|nr:hypothetical protein [bacterium]